MEQFENLKSVAHFKHYYRVTPKLKVTGPLITPIRVNLHKYTVKPMKNTSLLSVKKEKKITQDTVKEQLKS